MDEAGVFRLLPGEGEWKMIGDSGRGRAGEERTRGETQKNVKEERDEEIYGINKKGGGKHMG